MAPARKARVWTLLRWLVTAGLVALLLHLVDLDRAANLIVAAAPVFLLAALLVALADRAFMFAKWYPLLQLQDASIAWTLAFRVYLASGFASLFLPSSVGGDVVRTLSLGRSGNRLVGVGVSVAVERLLGSIAAGVLCLIALGVGLSRSLPLGSALVWTVALVVVGCALVILPLSERISLWLSGLTHRHANRPLVRLAHRFASAYTLYRRRPALLLLVGFLSLLEQGMPILHIWLVSLALPQSIALLNLFIAVPLAVFISRIPISVAGLGVGDGAFVYLLSLQGIPASAALAVAVLARVVELLAHVPGAVFWQSLKLGRRDAPSPERLPR